jgi:hypothetical protein
MPPLVRRSILKKLLIVVSCTLSVGIFTTLALAQHPAVRTPGGVVQMPTPPISHPRISSVPISRAPISTPRISVSPSADTLGTAGFRPPRRPIRQFPPVLVVYESPFLFGGPFWELNSCWSATCDLLGSWTLSYTTAASTGPVNDFSPVYENPGYDFGEESPDLPQLLLKDGTILNVTDYWLVDDQLHFKMIEQNGTESEEHVIPFEALNLQTTVDADTRRGFRFVLRNEPVEQYLRDHPERPPHIVTAPHQ